jgi:hypothetical protein
MKSTDRRCNVGKISFKYASKSVMLRHSLPKDAEVSKTESGNAASSFTRASIYSEAL